MAGLLGHRIGRLPTKAGGLRGPGLQPPWMLHRLSIYNPQERVFPSITASLCIACAGRKGRQAQQ